MGSAPTLGLKTPLPPRRKRAPRKLNYHSCASCRSASAKCVPGTRPWPEGKCGRCTEKNLICSARMRKSEQLNARHTDRHGPDHAKLSGSIRLEEEHTAETPTEESSRLPMTEGSARQISEEEATQDALTLVGVLAILREAVKELGKLREEFINFSSSFAPQAKVRFELCSKKYKLVQEDVMQTVIGMPSPVAVAVRATQNLCYTQMIKAHKGFQHEQFLEVLLNAGQTTPCQEAVNHFLGHRKKFLRHCVKILGKYKFGSSHTHSILRTELFLPNELLQMPRVLMSVRHDSRSDCLGRSVWCMAHDAGVHTGWPVAYLGDVDLLGRSAWYLACARQDTALLDQLLTHFSVLRHVPGSNFSPKDVIRAAASNGFTAVFQRLYKEDPKRFCERIRVVVDEKGLNCLDIAAKKGHRNTVEFLRQHLPPPFVNDDMARYLIWSRSPIGTNISIDQQIDLFWHTSLEMVDEMLSIGHDNEETMEDYILAPNMQDALTHERIEGRGTWGRNVLSVLEWCSEQEHDQMGDEKLDDKTEDSMDVLFDFDLWLRVPPGILSTILSRRRIQLSQNKIADPLSTCAPGPDLTADLPGTSTATSTMADSQTP